MLIGSSSSRPSASDTNATAVPVATPDSSVRKPNPEGALPRSLMPRNEGSFVWTASVMAGATGVVPIGMFGAPKTTGSVVCPVTIPCAWNCVNPGGKGFASARSTAIVALSEALNPFAGKVGVLLLNGMVTTKLVPIVAVVKATGVGAPPLIETVAAVIPSAGRAGAPGSAARGKASRYRRPPSSGLPGYASAVPRFRIVAVSRSVAPSAMAVFGASIVARSDADTLAARIDVLGTRVQTIPGAGHAPPAKVGRARLPSAHINSSPWLPPVA